ncbi:MAG: aldose 1-epimerase [Chitinophagaceae bacterium]
MAFSYRIEQADNLSSIWLIDSKSGFEAEIYTIGGILNAFTIEVNGEKNNVVDGFSSLEEAKKTLSDSFKSAFLSPFTCRMNKGNYRFNDIDYSIEKYYLPPHAIHGIVFDAVYTIKHIVSNETFACVTLESTYTGTDKGYPFHYAIEHEWKLASEGMLSVTTKITNQHVQSIPYAQGWHPYFSLSNTIDGCYLKIDTNTLIEFDDTLIPTGKKQLDTRFENGILLENIFLDNCFELKDIQDAHCTLFDEQLQLKIVPDKSYPFVQVYTPPERKSIAIENLSGAPDCFNNKMGLTMIEPNANAIFVTTYFLSKR